MFVKKVLPFEQGQRRDLATCPRAVQRAPVMGAEDAHALRTIELVDRYSKGESLDETPVADRVIRRYSLED